MVRGFHVFLPFSLVMSEILLLYFHFLDVQIACYHSVQNLLPSHLLSKNIKIRIYKTIILPVVLYGCETGLCIKEGAGCLRTGR
jgi:hypothetical protein